MPRLEPERIVETDRYKLILGDCLESLASLSQGAVISDPPYGVDNNCDYTRFTNGIAPSKNYDQGIAGDSEPFDPTPWLRFPEVILWGWQFFASHLSVGTVLVWNKKGSNQLGTFLSDAELAWKKGGVGVYLFEHKWHGFDKESERGEVSVHPSQKPAALMQWCIEKVKAKTIIDPYMGAGSTGVACMRLGRKFVGCEINEHYFNIAVERIERERLNPQTVASQTRQKNWKRLEQLLKKG